MGTVLMLRLASSAFPACPMKPYERISVLLTWEGNWKRGNASGAATRDAHCMSRIITQAELELLKQSSSLELHNSEKYTEHVPQA
ncbi:hypothetical protein PAMP_004124 [Pampus punctatissimus]